VCKWLENGRKRHRSELGFDASALECLERFDPPFVRRRTGRQSHGVAVGGMRVFVPSAVNASTPHVKRGLDRQRFLWYTVNRLTGRSIIEESLEGTVKGG